MSGKEPSEGETEHKSGIMWATSRYGNGKIHEKDVKIMDSELNGSPKIRR